MERWPFHIVDVFTERPLAGNQLAVFEDAAGIPESLLQPLAQEIGYRGDSLSPTRTARLRRPDPHLHADERGRRSPVTRCWGRRWSWPRSSERTELSWKPARTHPGAHRPQRPGSATRGAMEQPIPSFAPY